MSEPLLESLYHFHIMPFNQILAKKLIGTAVKDGATVTLSVATKTTHWTRPEFTADKVGTVLTKSLSN